MFGQGGAIFRVSKHGGRALELISVFLKTGREGITERAVKTQARGDVWTKPYDASLLKISDVFCFF